MPLCWPLLVVPSCLPLRLAPSLSRYSLFHLSFFACSCPPLYTRANLSLFPAVPCCSATGYRYNTVFNGSCAPMPTNTHIRSVLLLEYFFNRRERLVSFAANNLIHPKIRMNTFEGNNCYHPISLGIVWHLLDIHTLILLRTLRFTLRVELFTYWKLFIGYRVVNIHIRMPLAKM